MAVADPVLVDGLVEAAGYSWSEMDSKAQHVVMDTAVKLEAYLIAKNYACPGWTAPQPDDPPSNGTDAAMFAGFVEGRDRVLDELRDLLRQIKAAPTKGFDVKTRDAILKTLVEFGKRARTYTRR